MAQSAEQIRADLNVVYTFYLYLLENALGHEVPSPPQIAHDSEALRKFVALLEMAVTPQMIRDGLKSPEQKPAAEALLRFFAEKPSRRREDRDKIDVIATALFRYMQPGDQPAESKEEEAPQILAFEQELRQICAALEMPDPPPEHMQLVREFQFLRDEVSDFRHFDELIDSGILQKVRDFKQSLHDSLMHPSVLSVIAAYNVYFGYCFDRLFRQAAYEVKSFAAKVQQEGGSIMSRVDGDVIVKQLAEIDEGKILNEEYRSAQEDLRHVSKLKKAVDNRRFGKTAVQPSLQPRTNSSAGTPPQAASPDRARTTTTRTAVKEGIVPLAEQVSPSDATPSFRNFSGTGSPTPVFGPGMAYATPRSSVNIGGVEEQRLIAVQATIRSFARSTEPGSEQVVPLPQGNITLYPHEVEAFRTEYGNERSFRADYAALLMQIVSVDARLMTEMQEFLRTRKTLYNWKPHADAMANLLNYARTVYDNAMLLIAVAQQRGLSDKISSINSSFEKLRLRTVSAAETLQSIDAQT